MHPQMPPRTRAWKFPHATVNVNIPCPSLGPTGRENGGKCSAGVRFSILPQGQPDNNSLTTFPLETGNGILTKMTEVLTATQPIRLKGRSFLALVLSPELPFEDWLVRLDELAGRSAGFFMQRPVVLDVAGLDIDTGALKELIGELNDRDVRIMGIEGAAPDLLGPGLPPPLGGGLPASDFEAGRKSTTTRRRRPRRTAASRLITEPVRSGQTLMVDGDITIVGSVSSGAEVIAAGSIHVYGTIRGRALAGSMGDTNARIFCRKLEAELVAIAGFYKTSEDLDAELRGQAVQFRFDNDALLAEKLQ